MSLASQRDCMCNAPTTIEAAAKDNLDDVEARIAEIHEQIDYEQCCDPNYEMSDRENELFFELEELSATRWQLRKVVEEGLP